MSDLILYHYSLSPFSEKIRTMLGYAGLTWQSVIVKEMPPRPELAALAGGYRKIPVAQLGADVFCDTRSIAAEIARLANKPELDPDQQPEQVQRFIEEVDLEVFLACIISASGRGMLVKLIRNTSLLDAMRFLKDRVELGRKAKVKALSIRQAKHRLQAHLERMEAMLGQDFLFGDTPCAADFSAYHSLWFVVDVANKPVLEPFPAVQAWMEKMRAFGHGNVRQLPRDEALDLACRSTPRPLAEPTPDGQTQGARTVSIEPTDYGRDPVTGTLHQEREQGLILGHEHPRVGVVHLHFPRAGFKLTEAS
ncbi:glutathione S-transferase family protein [Marinobacter sp. SS21]|uniref:glutathione S-transferase family protein n=1 Tax=Marinobacter sp. SS21 TaxID=2979460 RepID=UPI00232F4C9C|nr:glutathione S-transferase family protein [Marinobacter sp. SS21]MDC0661542.1 glutathione S-transferase family protein [Marinobacter sp. SS21]